MSRLVMFGLIGAAAAFAQVDPKAIATQSVHNYESDWRAAISWTYTVTDVTYSDGARHVNVSEVAPRCGIPHERVIQKDGENPDPSTVRREESRDSRAESRCESETPEQHEARIRKYESERAFINDIPRAYSFALEGQDTVNGRPAWIVRLSPQPGFVPQAQHAAMLEHIEGRLWIDKQSVRWARAEATVIDTISIGWIVARIGPGAHITLEQEPLSENLWVPRKVSIMGAARVFMVHNKKLNEQLTWSDYHKSDSKSVGRREPSVGRQAPGARSFK